MSYIKVKLTEKVAAQETIHAVIMRDSNNERSWAWLEDSIILISTRGRVVGMIGKRCTSRYKSATKNKISENKRA